MHGNYLQWECLVFTLTVVGPHGRRSSVSYPWTRPLFCSCWSRMFSSFRGLGMKPISQPSFTNRPIHQSLLNFWTHKRAGTRKIKHTHAAGVGVHIWSFKVHLYLFYVEEILGVEGDGGGWHWNILIQGATVADVGPHGECHRFSLPEGNTVSGKEHADGADLGISISHRATSPSSATLALSSWAVACCSLSWQLCPGPWLWLGLWLGTWAGTSRSSSRETSESDGLLVYESAEPWEQWAHMAWLLEVSSRDAKLCSQ